jgi:hypothetical protein
MAACETKNGSERKNAAVCDNFNAAARRGAACCAYREVKSDDHADDDCATEVFLFSTNHDSHDQAIVFASFRGYCSVHEYYGGTASPGSS